MSRAGWVPGVAKHTEGHGLGMGWTEGTLGWERRLSAQGANKERDSGQPQATVESWF